MMDLPGLCQARAFKAVTVASAIVAYPLPLHLRREMLKIMGDPVGLPVSSLILANSKYPLLIGSFLGGIQNMTPCL